MSNMIFDLKVTLKEKQHLKKMQYLLEEYDRQTYFLNKQVNDLLKQNIKLKNQNLFNSSAGSRVLSGDNYNSKNMVNTFTLYTENKAKIDKNYKKNRYEYMFNELQLKNLKANLKKEIKQDTQKNFTTKQVQTNTQQLQKSENSSLKKETNFQSKNQNKFSQKQSNFTPVKYLQQQQNERKNVQIIDKQSKSKSKSKSKQKLQVSLKQNIKPKEVEEMSKFFSSSGPQAYSSTKQDQLERILKQARQKEEDFTHQQQPSYALELEQSFGHGSKLQKKFTTMDSNLSKEFCSQNFIKQSNITNKFLPLSIEVKQSLTNFSKVENQFHTNSKAKRNHSLNPSPKVDCHGDQLFSLKIKPFIIRTEQAIEPSSFQLHRNTSQKIKRKYINIISSKKFVAPKTQSPKKKD